MCPINAPDTKQLSASEALIQPSNEFFPCNCGHTGPLGAERCGADLSAFAVRCPGCNKSVQAFTEQGLLGNWNAVSRKNAPAQPVAPE